jgi:hypothetical protein
MNCVCLLTVQQCSSASCYKKKFQYCIDTLFLVSTHKCKRVRKWSGDDKVIGMNIITCRCSRTTLVSLKKKVSETTLLLFTNCWMKRWILGTLRLVSRAFSESKLCDIFTLERTKFGALIIQSYHSRE